MIDLVRQRFSLPGLDRSLPCSNFFHHERNKERKRETEIEKRWNVQWKWTLRLLQRDQIGRFLKVLGSNFYCKSSPNVWKNVRAFWKKLLESKNCCVHIFGNFWRNWASFHSTIWSYCRLRYLVKYSSARLDLKLSTNFSIVQLSYTEIMLSDWMVHVMWLEFLSITVLHFTVA